MTKIVFAVEEEKNPLNIFAVDGEIPGKLSILAQKSLNYT